MRQEELIADNDSCANAQMIKVHDRISWVVAGEYADWRARKDPGGCDAK